MIQLGERKDDQNSQQVMIMREILRFGCDPDYLSSCLGIKPDSEGEAREQFDELSIRAVSSEKTSKTAEKDTGNS